MKFIFQTSQYHHTNYQSRLVLEIKEMLWFWEFNLIMVSGYSSIAKYKEKSTDWRWRRVIHNCLKKREKTKK